MFECCCELKMQKVEEACQTKQSIRERTCTMKEEIDNRANKTNLLLRSVERKDLEEDLDEVTKKNLFTKLKHHR